MRKTGNETDFALNDANQFFVVQRGEEQLLTRAGNFLFDQTGKMTTQAGEDVLGTDGQPIRIQPNLPYQIQQGGRIAQGVDSHRPEMPAICLHFQHQRLRSARRWLGR